MHKKTSFEDGSVLIYILIAVALFAALGYAVSNMMRGSGNIGKEKAGIYASEIMNFARSMREAVQAMKISNACSDEQISFERPPFDGTDTVYFNTASPSDHSCQLFHAEGGGVGYQADFEGQSWQFTSNFNVNNVGTDASDLVAVLLVDQSICEIVNTRAGVSNEAINTKLRMNDGARADNAGLPEFNGKFEGTYHLGHAAYNGKMAGCYLSESSDGKEYTVYQVLIAR